MSPSRDDPSASRRSAGRRHEEPPEVSTETVRERLDPTSRTTHGELAPPPGSPGEAWCYPWRRLRVVSFPLVGLVTADALSGANAFLGAAVKGVLLVFVVLWQARATAATAIGEDVPPRASSVATSAADRLGDLARFVGVWALYFAPAALAYAARVLGEVTENRPVPPAWGWPVALLAIAAAPGPALLLGFATGNGALYRPLAAFGWTLRGPRACALVWLSWIGIGFAEVAVAGVAAAPTWLALAAYLAIRAAMLSLVLTGGRALGVLARRYPL